MPTLRVRDIELYYEISGQGQPLLLIHGLGSSTRDWEEQIPCFSRHYQVIAFDVRGHGRSAKPPGPYTVPMFAADAAELIRLLGCGPAHVVGISMGGMIAFQLAVIAPHSVRSLVIVNSLPELVARALPEKLRLWQRQVLVRALGMRAMGSFLSKRLFPEPEQAGLRRKLIERWAQNDPRAYRAAFQALIGWSVVDQLGEITCPTLMLASDADYTPVAQKRAYLARMKHGQLLVINGARHAVPVERPEEFNRAVLGFLSQLT